MGAFSQSHPMRAADPRATRTVSPIPAPTLSVATNTSLVAARGVSDESGLAQYIQTVQKIPILTAEEEYEYAKRSCERTYRWLVRCKKEMQRLNSLERTINKNQLLFGINQGSTYEDLRIEHMKRIRELDLDGYAIGGLAVGEATEDMYRIIDAVEPYMPEDKPRYLMGVGTCSNIIEGVARGIDFFDCVMPARNGRHGHLFTWEGVINIKNEKYVRDESPIDPQCECPVCRSYSRAYLRHLFKAEEMLAMRLAVMHNLYFYNTLAERIRTSLDEGTFEQFRARYSGKLEKRV